MTSECVKLTNKCDLVGVLDVIATDEGAGAAIIENVAHYMTLTENEKELAEETAKLMREAKRKLDQLITLIRRKCRNHDAQTN